MSKQYIFRVQVLNVQDVNLMQTIANLSGETQFDILNADKNMQVINSANTEKVVWNSIVLPERYEQQDMYRELPDYLKFRSPKANIVANARNVLWKNVIAQDVRANSQLARLFTFSIPHFFSVDECVSLLSKFSKSLVDLGMIVDASIHDHNQTQKQLSAIERLNILQGKATPKSLNKDAEQDYTGYALCTLREYKDGYFQNKNRSWNLPQNALIWRKEWIPMLYEAILTSKNGTPEEITSWVNKMKIYPEYQEIQERFNSHPSNVEIEVTNEDKIIGFKEQISKTSFALKV